MSWINGSSERVAMAALADEVDVAVIGAGAAGIAAARRLVAAADVSVVVLEARERAGGRAWTVEADDFPIDVGCEWLHAANRNMLTPLAAQLGFSIDKKRPDWTTRLRHSGESKEAEADWLREREAHYSAMHRAAQRTEDQPASSVLVPGGRWNMLLDAISTWTNGVELESLSVKDNDRYEDSGINWRLREGYGSLFAALAAGLSDRIPRGGVADRPPLPTDTRRDWTRHGDSRACHRRGADGGDRRRGHYVRSALA
jgi:monoamine oxidase